MAGYLTPGEIQSLRDKAERMVVGEHAEPCSDCGVPITSIPTLKPIAHAWDCAFGAPFTTDGPDSPLGYDGYSDDSTTFGGNERI